MLFDSPRELPVATLRRAPSSLSARLAGSLARWITTQWSWLRPRTVPVLVAAIGMVAVLNAVNYLAHPPAAQLASSVSDPVAEQPTTHIKLVLQP